MEELKSKHLVGLVAIIGASILAYFGKRGWGWLVFIAFCAM